MNRQRLIRLYAAVLIGFVSVPFNSTEAQQLTSDQKAEAQRQLQMMSPDEIDQKIKSLGMTREEAEKRAKENGIDLQSFLKSTSMPGSTLQPTQIIIESGPQGVSTVHDQSATQGILPSVLKKPVKTDRGLPYFGYDVFSTTPTAFEPNAAGPVDPEYVIGPEDVLRVSVWGQVEQQNELSVDKEGRIFLPTAGPVVVSGLTVDEVQKKLVKQLSRSFQGLNATPPTVWLDVTLARIRPKRIFIMGEVENPGGYTVSSYATIFASLFAVGGPTVNGSLREIRLIRDNKVVTKIDLYSYLTGSEKNNDVRVQNNDIIFVPVRKNALYIKGEIRKPGIYELLPGENLKKLIEYAGGNLPTSYLERVQVERIIPLKERVKNELERRYIDINYRQIISKNSDYPLADGDLITFYSVLDEVKNYVSISGSVYKPGTYQLTSGMRLLDLIELADSLKPETYLIRGELTRLNPDNTTRITIPFDLNSLVAGDTKINILLQPRDEILIHTIGISQELNEFIEIRGSVKKPGRYSLTKNMTLVDAIMLAEGYTEDASSHQAEIARIEKTRSGDTLAYIYFSDIPTLRDTLQVQNFSYFETIRRQDINLKHRDHIFIRPNPNYHPQQLVTVTGEVMYPGDYALITYNDYLSDIIKRAGGKTSAAYLQGGTLMRGDKRVNVDFQQVVESPKTIEDIVLHAGDRIHLPKKPNTITMSGQINNPGLLGFIEGNDLWEYIDRAGGLTDSADYIFLFSPTGNVEKFNTGWFAGNADILDGSTIYVSKIPVPPVEQKALDVGNLIRDIFAITASALTILVLSKQL